MSSHFIKTILFVCPELDMWYFESYSELSVDNPDIDKSYAIYPKRFYKNINLHIDKKYDFIFIGGLLTDISTHNNRKWIIPFINNNFNCNSYLQFTDKKTKQNYKIMGNYDHTLSENGFVPKEVKREERYFFDKKYFDNLSQSKFCLCPAGDSMWSMRFYECLMCKCIPIVNTVDETYRSKEEAKLDYKYYLSTDKEFIYREDWVEHNYNIFLQYHTLEYFYTNIHIFGMRRSRSHLICNAVQKHYKNHKFYNNFGDGTILNNGKEGYLLEEKVNNLYKKLIDCNNIILFEDKLFKMNSCNKTITLLIIRDIYDLIISRIYKNTKWSIINEIFIDTYKKLLKEVLNIDNNIKNKIVIDTDKFIKDTKYRNNLLNSINIKNYIYSEEVKRKEGGGKTFKNIKDCQTVKISLDVYNLIKNDTEFIDLIYKYYKYDILEKLENHML